MKLKRISISILFILLLLLSACGSGVNPKDHLGEIYTIALDSIMQEDQALNSGMEFIAIDTSNLEELTKQDKKEIIHFFRDTYKTEIMEATYEELVEKGLYNPETTVLDGVLLRMEEVDYSFNNQIIFKGSKYRSGLGAVGIEVTIHYKNDSWLVKSSKMTWIS